MKTLQVSINAIFGFRRATPSREAERRADRAAMAKARRLATKHGITIERDDRDYWVTYTPLLDTGDDPLEGGHFCTSGREVLEAVDVYARHLSTPSQENTRA